MTADRRKMHSHIFEAIVCLKENQEWWDIDLVQEYWLAIGTRSWRSFTVDMAALLTIVRRWRVRMTLITNSKVYGNIHLFTHFVDVKHSLIYS